MITYRVLYKTRTRLDPRIKEIFPQIEGLKSKCAYDITEEHRPPPDFARCGLYEVYAYIGTFLQAGSIDGMVLAGQISCQREII